MARNHCSDGMEYHVLDQLSGGIGVTEVAVAVKIAGGHELRHTGDYVQTGDGDSEVDSKLGPWTKSAAGFKPAGSVPGTMAKCNIAHVGLHRTALKSHS